MARRDVHQANPSAEPVGIWRSGQACDQDVLLYCFSLVHPIGNHRDGFDILDVVKARLKISMPLNDRINTENYLSPLLGKCKKIGASTQNKQEKLN